MLRRPKSGITATTWPCSSRASAGWSTAPPGQCLLGGILKLLATDRQYGHRRCGTATIGERHDSLIVTETRRL